MCVSVSPLRLALAAVPLFAGGEERGGDQKTRSVIWGVGWGASEIFAALASRWERGKTHTRTHTHTRREEEEEERQLGDGGGLVGCLQGDGLPAFSRPDPPGRMVRRRNPPPGAKEPREG